MKIPAFLRFSLLGTGCMLVAPITCNSIFSKSKPADTTNEAWEYVNVVGSNIPQRVIKGQRPLTPSPVGIMGTGTLEGAAAHGRAELNGRTGL